MRVGMESGSCLAASPEGLGEQGADHSFGAPSHLPRRQILYRHLAAIEPLHGGDGRCRKRKDVRDDDVRCAGMELGGLAQMSLLAVEADFVGKQAGNAVEGVGVVENRQPMRDAAFLEVAAERRPDDEFLLQPLLDARPQHLADAMLWRSVRRRLPDEGDDDGDAGFGECLARDAQAGDLAQLAFKLRADGPQGIGRHERLEFLQSPAQVARQAPVVRDHLSELVQGGAEAEEREQPPRSAGIDRQRQLGGEDFLLAAWREAVEEEQQRVRQQWTKARVSRGQQLAQAQQRGQQAVLGGRWQGHGWWSAAGEAGKRSCGSRMDRSRLSSGGRR
ncbi:MAG: hypothetical protein AW08_03794 [Candidatus Accumulibacter adjunctus]|uniref:Uncharacterized protein n=1 Tax=Candidatus Accumulibacter adjunctus TaxID=1454001 RepID=A0A011PCY2_9PROT|nr:MAG: hypothetical protein AW08_03794 [Candidatus Accumulibacter adjunctus]